MLQRLLGRSLTTKALNHKALCSYYLVSRCTHLLQELQVLALVGVTGQGVSNGGLGRGSTEFDVPEPGHLALQSINQVDKSKAHTDHNRSLWKQDSKMFLGYHK